ncbi:hypothetical protein B7463_g10683, partial [Scytalidium lignicola]
MGSNDVIPYWNVNLPISQHTLECPEFLKNLKKKDLGIISTPDAEYHILSWQELQKFIADNRLDIFQRVPSQLRRYLEYIWNLKLKYGSVMEFVLSERLKWEIPFKAEAAPFKSQNDLKILYNDWPYGIDPKIVHLVVWTKFELLDDPLTDDLTDEARREIDEYVDETFSKRVGKENVIWFKNWKSLKSVHAVEHFHVMLYNPDPQFVKEITNGDVPLSLKF